jgi:hypothetical protein
MTEPLFPFSERRKRIPLTEIAKLTGYSAAALRSYAKKGFFEAAQAAPRTQWYVERHSFELWYRTTNHLHRKPNG